MNKKIVSGSRSIISEVLLNEKKILEYVIDETLIKTGVLIPLIIKTIAPKNMHILALSISKEKNIYIGEVFIRLSSVVKIHRKNPGSTDGNTAIFYPSLRIPHTKYNIHSPI